MSKRLVALIAVFLLAANLSAGDPWRDKPYKQWDEKDIRKILTDSPWAKTVPVVNTWGGAGTGADFTPLGPSGGDPRDIRPEKPPADQVPQAAFVVRWGSLRRALARRALLRGVAEPEVERFLAQEPALYEVMVSGPDMTPFASADEKDLQAMQERSSLASKKSRTRLAPERVEVERGPDGKRIVAVHFYFAKKTAAGPPPLSAEEKGAEFICQVGRTTLKANFDFQKMTDNQGTDL